ncbi:MAG: secretion protein HlyD [Caulobacteraceae bacterium]|nr:secretion protein HlyD [Caulobacteraceae bacterium]
MAALRGLAVPGRHFAPCLYGEPDYLFRRHFFLIGALLILGLMVVAGGLKVVTNAAGGAGGPAAKQAGGMPKGPGGPGGGRGGPSPVSMSVATPHSFSDMIEVLGVAKGRQSVTLTAATTQLVQRVRFTDGQSVPRGAVLVELQNTEQDAGLAQALARQVEAKRAYDRYRQLGEQGFASKSATDQYEAAYLSAQADVAVARARQNDRMIRAPFAGVVGISDIAPGALVNPGAPIVTLDDLSAIRVDFQVPERYLSQLREGQSITASVDAYPGEAIPGHIAKLDTRIDERTRAITARAEFPNVGRKLKPGMMVRVAVSHGARTGVGLPESAVAVESDSSFVYVIKKEGARTVTEQRSVTTGVRQGGFVEISEGLEAGEKVVADGLNKIQPGAPVRVVGSKAGGRLGGALAGAVGAGAAGARPTT